MTRVLVAAASTVTRAGLEAILARDPALIVVGNADASTPDTLAAEVAAHDPEVVLLELPSMADEESMNNVQMLIGGTADAGMADIGVVVLTDDASPGRLIDALHHGVRGLLPRGATANEILAAVTSAAAGLVCLPPEWLAVLHDDAALTPSSPQRTGDGASLVGTVQPRSGSATPPLTPRELDVLRLIAEGLANKQIAARLGISDHTVKFHIGSVFAKLEASTRAEAVAIGARRGLIVV